MPDYRPQYSLGNPISGTVTPNGGTYDPYPQYLLPSEVFGNDGKLRAQYLSPAQTTRFTDSQIATVYSIPAGATQLLIRCVGSGGGGGGGRRGATGTARFGGGGGGGGAYSELLVMVADLLGATQLLVTVPAAGVGGAGATSDNTTGNSGTIPVGPTKVTLPDGTLVVAAASGSNGRGGSDVSGVGGAVASGQGGLYAGGAGGSGADGTTPSIPASFTGGAAGGAGGGGIGSNETLGTGGSTTPRGTRFVATTATAAPNLLPGGAAGQDGVNAVVPPGLFPGGGPAGGGPLSTEAGRAGNGGKGVYGSGGAGGGASTNGTNAGNGGDGGLGFVEITASF